MQTHSTRTLPDASTLLVVSSAAPTKGAFGHYRKLAILHAPQGVEPSRIARERGVTIVRLAERLSVGKTERAEFQRTLARCLSDVESGLLDPA